MRKISRERGLELFRRLKDAPGAGPTDAGTALACSGFDGMDGFRRELVQLRGELLEQGADPNGLELMAFLLLAGPRGAKLGHIVREARTLARPLSKSEVRAGLQSLRELELAQRAGGGVWAWTGPRPRRLAPLFGDDVRNVSAAAELHPTASTWGTSIWEDYDPTTDSLVDRSGPDG